MTTIPAAAVLRLREALYSELGNAAAEIDAIRVTPRRAHDDWSPPVARFDRTRALLDELGWNERDPEHDTEINLDQHRQVIVAALNAQLEVEHHLMSEKGDAAKTQRQRAYARALTIETWAKSIGLELI
jgi:hypothetical protein